MNIYKIGIDPGTSTGIAIVKNGVLTDVKTLSITQAIHHINTHIVADKSSAINLYVEDPNLRRFFGNTGREKLQGAGSVKRDFKIWSDFAKENGLNFTGIAPATIGSTFDNEKVFKAATKWPARTTKHARDAVKIVFKFMECTIFDLDLSDLK